MKTDIFNIYSSKSFFLPTPSPREVFRKRVEYLKAKLSSSAPGKTQREYFAGKGIRVTIKDLNAFAAVVETVFIDQDYAAKRIGEISNYNMRQTLHLSKRVITSSVLGIEDLIRSYITGTLVAPSPARFMSALIKGNYELFRPGDEALLFPLFQVDSTVRQSPLIHLHILILLRDKHATASEDTDRYMTVQSVFGYFDLMGISEVGVQSSLEALLLAGLIEPYDLSKREYSDDQRLAITHSGLAHLDFGLSNPIFFEQMALTSRIPDAEIAAQIRGAYRSSSGGIDARMEEVRELFCSYLVTEDGRNCAVPTTLEFRSQYALSSDLTKQWKASRVTAEQMMSLPDVAASHTTTTVERFDHDRGFGFVEVPELRDTAFLHARIIEQAGFDDVYDGDTLVCEISRNEKGLTVSRVFEVRAGKKRVYGARVVKLLADRFYGFVHVPEIGTDAFFHYHLFSEEEQVTLTEGQQLSVEITTDSQGRSQVRRILASVPT